MPTWPTAGGFPQAPLVGSWGRQAADIVTEFKPSVGPPRVRRIVTTAQFNCSGMFHMTAAQVATLMDFFVTDCLLGEMPFTWTDPEDRTTARTWEWASVPQRNHIALDRYEVSVSLIRQI